MGRNAIDRRLGEIARSALDIPTLETRRSDGLDFHEVSVWTLREALLAAYLAGREAGPLPRTAPCPRCGAEITVQLIST